MIELDQETKIRLWALILSANIDFKRIIIADHEHNGETFTLWVEDTHDFKNSLDECVKIKIPILEFASFIESQKHNSYVGRKVHPRKQFIYEADIVINEPVAWYDEDASAYEQKDVRESLLQSILKGLLKDLD